MRYVKLNNGTIIDLLSNEVSSFTRLSDEEARSDEWGLEGATYMVYYYDEEKGAFLETDGQGGRSMDNFFESEIIETSDDIEDLFDMIGTTKFNETAGFCFDGRRIFTAAVYNKVTQQWEIL